VIWGLDGANGIGAERIKLARPQAIALFPLGFRRSIAGMGASAYDIRRLLIIRAMTTFLSCHLALGAGNQQDRWPLCAQGLPLPFRSETNAALVHRYYESNAINLGLAINRLVEFHIRCAPDKFARGNITKSNALVPILFGGVVFV